MTVKNLSHRIFSRAPRPSLRRHRETDRALLFSLCLSLLIHAAAGAALFFAARPARVHVFMLVEAGEEALEMDVGSFFESAESVPRPIPEVSERRAEQAPAETPPPERETPPKPDDPPASPLEAPPEARLEREPLERAAPSPVRTDRAADRDQPEPAERSLAPAEERPEPAKSALAGKIEMPERRFDERDSNPPPAEAVAARPLPPEPEPPPAAAPPSSETPAPTEPALAAVPDRLTRPARNRYHERNETPEPVRPKALSAPPAPASAPSRLGASEQIRGVRERARPLQALTPRYPESSRRRGEAGVATVRAVIDASGRCRSAQLEASSGYSALDNAALDAVRRASYAPARLDGMAAETEERFAIDFRLR